tara:strand:+ start:6988 stop:7200 length:213 start_codon:yes stop_codon:yes gene_type:complete
MDSVPRAFFPALGGVWAVAGAHDTELDSATAPSCPRLRAARPNSKRAVVPNKIHDFGYWQQHHVFAEACL